MKTEELIVELARSAGAVRPLPSPGVRLARWAAAVLPPTLLGVLAIGPRRDLFVAIATPSFASLAAITLATGALAAAAALVLAVPGAERSPLQRAAPVAAASAWALALAGLLIAGGSPLPRLAALPMHWACTIEIAAFSVIPGWVLFAMIRRAAPLRPIWSAALAALSATAIGAAATQVLCPIDDPAHQLAGHFAPAMAFALLVVVAGRRSLDWRRRTSRSPDVSRRQ